MMDAIPSFLCDFEKFKDSEHGTPESPPLAHALLLDAMRARASDLRIEPLSGAKRVRFRIDGILHTVAMLTNQQGQVLLNQFKAISDLDPVTRFTPRDTRTTVHLEEGHIDLRLALAPCAHGEMLSVRLLDSKR